MKIGQEVLIKEIAELGILWLHGLDSLAGGRSLFARAAELLANRTKTQLGDGS
jgi:hypothetical protein